jgi:hypothetical protein
MENALSPFLANIFMADLKTLLSKLKIFRNIWIRYVDDIFCVMKKNTIDRMLVIMNRRHNRTDVKNKDKTKMLQNSEIYQVECEGFDYVYIGQIKRSLKTCFGEQHSSIRWNHLDKLNIG